MSHLPASPLRPVLRVDFPGERLGRGKIALLEAIRETGSISAAGRALGMSYRRAWQLATALNTMFGQEAIASQRGGKQGGGAALTPFGEELIRRFRSMENKAATALQEDLDWLDAARRPQEPAKDQEPQS
ncbi:winged helix-turn-helix domain-containing protein [Rhizobium sp. YIM 134829]|uniref:winged helix-turn-helix domain-containing protein n=1 Tax=Rhizobium sp. YIM 134829 TaxID=3390453 RepID=UPI00397A1FA9